MENRKIDDFCVDSGTDDWTYYTYNIENQLTIEETGGTATYYEYDAAGALISKITDGDESTYDYTYEGQMDEYASGDDTAYFTLMQTTVGSGQNVTELRKNMF